MLREIEAGALIEAVRDLCIEANTRLPQEHLNALGRALEAEESELGREVMICVLQGALATPLSERSRRVKSEMLRILEASA